MGYISDDTRKVTTHRLIEMKQRGEKISMLTSYDYTMAQIVDGAGVDVILVGDSASNVMAGNVKLSVLTHETAHAILHKELDKTQIKSEAQMEFEADATSVMLQSYFGLQIPESRQRHLADQYKTMCADKSISSADITKSLDHSHRAYKSVADNINNSLKPELTPSIKNVQAAQVTQPILPNQIAMPDMGMAMMM